MAAVRKDYELALQLGTRDVWNAFLAQYPDGLYASLAKGQLNRIAAEEARVAATEKARAAAEEKERLAAEGARKAEQEKAAAQARAAEEARIAAEKAKQIEQAKAAAAEEKRAAAEKVAAEKLVAEKAAADKAAAEKAAKAEADRKQAEQAAAEAAARKMAEPQPDQKVAALPPETSTREASHSLGEIGKSVQIELRRVGCFTGSADGAWSASTQRALERFNKSAGLKLDVKLASLDTLDAIKAKPSRVCPLVCERGYRASGDSCVRITCAAGSFVNDNNECEKRREKPRRQEVRRKPEPAVQPSPATKPTSHCVAGVRLMGDIMSGKALCS